VAKKIEGYTCQECADLYDVKLRTIYNWKDDGTIPKCQQMHYSLGAKDKFKLRIKKKWVDADLERLGIKPKA